MREATTARARTLPRLGVMLATTVLLVSGCGDGDEGGPAPDTTPPAAVADLSLSAVTDSSATLSWQAPGDDGISGTASAYDIRHATGIITEESWSVANSVDAPPAPGGAGSAEVFTVSGLLSGTLYCFALKTVDDAANWSGISNVVSDTTCSGSSGGKMVLIRSGSFAVGSPADEPFRSDDEAQHWAHLTRDFSISETEVTNQEYLDAVQWAYNHGYVTATGFAVQDNLDGSTEILLDLDGIIGDISFSDGVFSLKGPGQADHPVVEVSWFGAARYCDWLSLQACAPRAYEHGGDWTFDGGDPYGAVGYRLPTETEWEYACRAGTSTPFNTGSCLDADTQANYEGNHPYVGCSAGESRGGATPVRSFPANAWGLYDMHGNVWEWCADWYGTYPGGTQTNPLEDPPGPAEGSERIVRGGDWFRTAFLCRSAQRGRSDPGGSNGQFGFRFARSVF